MSTTLHVCTTCRGPEDGEARPGRDLLARLEARLAVEPRPGVAIAGVECLSVCKRPCTVALASPGRWTYVYAGLDPATAADDLLAGAALYAATPDGIVPWRARPEILRKGVVARVPPLKPSEAAE